MPQAGLTEYELESAEAAKNDAQHGPERVNELAATVAVHHVAAAGVRDSFAKARSGNTRECTSHDVGFQNGVLLVLPGAAGCVAHRMLT